VDAEEYRKKIEQDILVILEEKLRNGQMDVKRAQSIARMVLDKLHPPLSLQQIYAIAPTLDDEFSELAGAVLPIIKEHDEKVRSIVVQHVEKLITSGNLMKRIKLLKKRRVRKNKHYGRGNRGFHTRDAKNRG